MNQHKTTLTTHGTFVESVAASGSVVTRAEVKEWLGIDVSDDSQNDTLDDLLEMAVNEYETANRMALLSSTWLLKLDRFPECDTIEIRDKLPVSSVSSITYYDVDNSSQTFAASNYLSDTDSRPARIRLVETASWPSTYDRDHAVTVTFVGGYANAAAVPADVKQAIKLMVMREFDGEYNRETAMAIRHQMNIRGRGLYS